MATRDEGPVSHSQITELLVRWREGDHAALNQLVPLVYDELRRLARSHLRREAAGLNIQSAALVHEAYLRMVGKSRRIGRIALTSWSRSASHAGDPG